MSKILRLLPFLLLLAASAVRAEVAITPAEVFSQALLIEQETALVRQHYRITTPPRAVAPVAFDLQPRHVWQKAYLVQMKLVAFRRKHGMDAIAPVMVEPRELIDPRYTWAQVQRLLTEVRILHRILGIPGEVGAAPQVTEKRSVDVFNKLAEIEAQWDTITGATTDPSHTFAQALRLSEDVDALLHHLELFDNAVPPAKRPGATSADSLAQAFRLLTEVQRLQVRLGLPTTDFSAFSQGEGVTPADVINLVCLTLAELQQVKARVGLKHFITPAASFQEGKRPTDVEQLLGYITNKLALIQRL